jgi:hypothetical protein
MQSFMVHETHVSCLRVPGFLIAGVIGLESVTQSRADHVLGLLPVVFYTIGNEQRQRMGHHTLRIDLSNTQADGT